MSNSKQIIVEISSQDAPENNNQYHKVASFPASIGRGFDNDIIIDDAFICSRHLEINLIEDGEDWVINTLETVNGVTVNKDTYLSESKTSSIPLKSGDHIHIGKTTLKIYDVNHQVEETQKLHKQHGLFTMLGKPINSWLLFFVATAVAASIGYLSTWDKESSISTISTAMVWIGACLIWSSSWALTGRINKHKSYFLEQIGLVSLYLIISDILYYIQLPLDFALHENLFALIIEVSSNSLLVFGLVYGCLVLSSNHSRRRNIRDAALFTVAMVAIILMFSYIKAGKFSVKPKYSDVLEPYFSSLGKHNDIESYMANNHDMFIKEFD